MLQCVEYSWRGVTLREMRSPFKGEGEENDDSHW